MGATGSAGLRLVSRAGPPRMDALLPVSYWVCVDALLPGKPGEVLGSESTAGQLCDCLPIFPPIIILITIITIIIISLSLGYTQFEGTLRSY